MAKSRLVSIIMPVFNAQDFLSQSIESILNQTYSNFEFIIVDDASTDKSWSIIKSYSRKDKRIKIFRNQKNHGVSFTSNKAIKLCQDQFLARMDADDISFPDRIEKQLNYLQKNPQTVAVGAQCVVINKFNQVIGYKNFPLNHPELQQMIFWAIPLQQPSCMINLQKLPPSFHWYASNSTSAEEVDLIFKLMQYGQIANLKDNLLFYRYLDTSLSHKNPKKTFQITLKSRVKALQYGFRPSFKAVLINIIQIILVNILPSNFINLIWLQFRGIKETNLYPQLNKELHYNSNTI